MVVVDVVHPKGREVEKEEEKKKERKIPGKRVPSSSYWIGDGALDNVKVNALPIPSPERKNPAKIQQKSQSISRITLLVTSIVLTRFEKTNHGYLVWLSGKKKKKRKKALHTTTFMFRGRQPRWSQQVWLMEGAKPTRHDA